MELTWNMGGTILLVTARVQGTWNSFSWPYTVTGKAKERGPLSAG